MDSLKRGSVVEVMLITQKKVENTGLEALAGEGRHTVKLRG